MLPVNLREQFETQVKKYLEQRSTFENQVIKIDGMINMLGSFTGLDEILESVKDRTKREFSAAIKLGIETARAFNSVCLWSILWTPHPEYAGSYSWYSLQCLYRKEAIVERKP